MAIRGCDKEEVGESPQLQAKVDKGEETRHDLLSDCYNAQARR